MVIREAEEEDESTTQLKPDTSKIPQPTTHTRATQPQPAPPVTRTRKAKETQLRLGVGRPKVAGGVGARAVTKSLSVPKNKRVSKNIKIPETTIPEEQDPGTEYSRRLHRYFLLTALPSEHQPPNPPDTTHIAPPAVGQTTPAVQGPPQNFEMINEYMQNIVGPLVIQCTHLLTSAVRFALSRNRFNASSRSLKT